MSKVEFEAWCTENGYCYNQNSTVFAIKYTGDNKKDVMQFITNVADGYYAFWNARPMEGNLVIEDRRQHKRSYIMNGMYVAKDEFSDSTIVLIEGKTFEHFHKKSTGSLKNEGPFIWKGCHIEFVPEENDIVKIHIHNGDRAKDPIATLKDPSYKHLVSEGQVYVARLDINLQMIVDNKAGDVTEILFKKVLPNA